jgi:hypothetical protein
VFNWMLHNVNEQQICWLVKLVILSVVVVVGLTPTAVFALATPKSPIDRGNSVALDGVELA